MRLRPLLFFLATSLTLLALAAGRAKTQNIHKTVAPAPSTHLSISRSAAHLLPVTDKFVALAHLPPLRRTALRSGDIEARLWGTFNNSQTMAYLLKRTGGVWSGIDLLPPERENAACHYQMRLPTPRGGWEMLWEILESQGIRTLPDNLPPKAIDHLGKNDNFYLIEIEQDGKYRACIGAVPDTQRGNTKPNAKGMIAIVRSLTEAFCFNTSSYKGDLSLNPEARQHLLNDDFQEFRDVSKIPDWVRLSLVRCGWPPGKLMANPGEEWQIGDVVRKYGLPWRSLRFGGVAGDYCLLAYEHGGIGRSSNLILLHRNASGPNEVTLEGCTSLDTRINSVAGIQELERTKGAFRDHFSLQ
jgi:hypothetical protein